MSDTGFSKESDAGGVTLFFYARKHSTTLLGKPFMRKPRVRAEPDEPKAPYTSFSMTPFRLRIYSLQSMTILEES